MTDEQLEALLEELEAGFREDVQAALTLTASEFADAVAASTELVAAAFSVSRIKDMWTKRVPGLMRRLRSLAGRSAAVAAEELDETVPAPEELDRQLAPYLEATTMLVDAVGDHLAADAIQVLAEGVGAGESLPELKARMIAAFNDTGAQLGPVRAERIAQTESTRAWNAGALAAAQVLTGPDRPLVKQWLTRNDERVRQAHRDANGQLQLLDDPFDVGGTPMMYPGDPAAPADLTIQCRCIMRAAVPAAPAIEGTASMNRDDDLSAAADVHTGAMVALMPSVADAERMAIEGGEPVDQLHVTLAYLGDAADWTDRQRVNLINAVGRAAGWLSPVQARAFGVARWNSSGPEPAWVWNIGDDQDADTVRLADVHGEIRYQVGDLGYELPMNHTPWSPHVTATYGAADQAALDNGTGPLTFDRIRVAFGGDYTDFPLTLSDVPDDFADEPMAELAVDSAPALVTWSTPGDTALAFENQQTGDGRLFTPGALFWDGPGPWPLQYADEMRSGHDGAELAGAIHTIGRDGDRIPGEGVLYLTQQAGAEAAMLLAQGAPLGVSVDLDDVDIQMVDATGGEAFTTKLITASVMPLPDGGWSLDGETQPTLTASGTSTVIASQRVAMLVAADGKVPASVLTAAAGQPDAPDGVVVDEQRSGDYLVRITRGRVRGATLVSIPAYANARIVLDDAEMFASAEAVGEETLTASQSSDYERVLRHVRRSNTPVGAARVAQFLKVPLTAVHRHLARAAQRGEVVRLARGLYTDRTTSVRADHVMTDDRLADGDDRMVASDTEETEDQNMDDLIASAFETLKEAPAFPAEWFAEPTVDELPPGGPGVNYSNGRIFGWVAQAGEAHAGFAKKITIDGLGRIDTTHFLRQRFTLNDGSTVKAGAFTMNAGHHRDGAECETSACQFDDTRTVAGIVTVGMNERGMWFSGAAAPWLSEWDRAVFMATQPSYHMRKGPSGNWQLRAVLAVPVPGHSSPLLASAVVERSQMALTASATMAEVEAVIQTETARQAAEELPLLDVTADLAASIDYDRLAEALVAATEKAEARKRDEAAELEALLAEARTMGPDTTGTEGN